MTQMRARCLDDGTRFELIQDGEVLNAERWNGCIGALEFIDYREGLAHLVRAGG